MLTEEYYNFILGRIAHLPVEKRIAYRIANDLRGRGGIGDEWGQIDPDIQEEILQTMINLAHQEMEGKA